MLDGYSPVRHLASAAFPCLDRHKCMVMLSAYMDETGHSSDEKQKFVGMAGLIAPAQNWEVFEAKWRAALKLPYIDLPYFHMTDFAARKKHYKGWSEIKRRKVLGKLLTVIETALPLPFGTIIPLHLYRSLSDEHKAAFGDPYLMCFQNAVAACTTFLDYHKRPAEEKIALVFSDQVEFRHRALQIYEVIKPLEGASRATPPVFRDMRDIMPLQAADIVAYEMYKEYERRLYRPNAAPRFGLQRLDKMTRRNNYGRILFRFFDEKQFERYIKYFDEADRVTSQLVREGKLSTRNKPGNHYEKET